MTIPETGFDATVRLIMNSGQMATRYVWVLDFGPYGLVCRTEAMQPLERTLIPWHRVHELIWSDLLDTSPVGCEHIDHERRG